MQGYRVVLYIGRFITINLNHLLFIFSIYILFIVISFIFTKLSLELYGFSTKSHVLYFDSFFWRLLITIGADITLSHVVI